MNSGIPRGEKTGAVIVVPSCKVSMLISPVGHASFQASEQQAWFTVTQASEQQAYLTSRPRIISGE